MSICRARLRRTYSALTLRMSGEQIRLQVSNKLFRVNRRRNMSVKSLQVAYVRKLCTEKSH